MRDGAWQQFLILAVFAAFALLDVLLRWLRRPRQGTDLPSEPLEVRDERFSEQAAERELARPRRASAKPDAVVLRPQTRPPTRSSTRPPPRVTARTPVPDRMAPEVSRRARRPMLDAAAARQGIVTMVILGPCRALE